MNKLTETLDDSAVLQEMTRGGGSIGGEGLQKQGGKPSNKQQPVWDVGKGHSTSRISETAPSMLMLHWLSG